ncbi:MAG TPA: hypothetical protein VGA69_06275 [Nitriliruptorales bacterium]
MPAESSVEPASLARSYVGPAEQYDVAAAMQFNLLTARETDPR